MRSTAGPVLVLEAGLVMFLALSLMSCAADQPRPGYSAEAAPDACVPAGAPPVESFDRFRVESILRARDDMTVNAALQRFRTDLEATVREAMAATSLQPCYGACAGATLVVRFRESWDPDLENGATIAGSVQFIDESEEKVVGRIELERTSYAGALARIHSVITASVGAPEDRVAEE